MTYANLWWRAFWETQALEVPMYVAAFHLFPARPLWQRTDEPLAFPGTLGVAFLASALTHPLVWYFFPFLPFFIDDYWPMVAVAETFAVLCEAAWFAFCGVNRPLLLSLVANGASASFGFLVH